MTNCVRYYEQTSESHRRRDRPTEGPAMTARSSDLSTPDLLAGLGLPAGDGHGLPASAERFPDGSQYRVEIPSVEGPRCLEAVLTEAERLAVPVARVSQGTGVGLLTDAEIVEMAEMAAGAGVEISLFARPCAGWDASAMVRSPTGALLAPCARGQDQLVAVVDEIRRAADLGIRSVLVSDVGVLAVFGRLRAANPAAARLFADLGADTLNLPTDLTLAQVSAIRSATPVPLDVYVEAPDNLGGFVRHYEMPRLVA